MKTETRSKIHSPFNGTPSPATAKELKIADEVIALLGSQHISYLEQNRILNAVDNKLYKSAVSLRH